MNAKNNLQHKYTFHYIKGFSKFYPPNLFAGDVYLDDEVLVSTIFEITVGTRLQ